MPSPEEQIQEKVTAAMHRAGEMLVQMARDEIRIPWPPASLPYQFPHRRSGNLQDLIHFQVDEFHDGATLTLISDAEYSINLKEGIGMDPRSFFDWAAEDRYGAVVTEQLQAAFPIGVESMSDAQLGNTFGIEIEP